MNSVLVDRAESIFIKNNCDRTNSQVIAAVITASSKMASASGIVSEEVTLREMIDAYGVEDNKTVLSLIGLPYLYTNSLIGYPNDYDTPSNAILGYYKDKRLYDSFYASVLSYAQEKEKTKQNHSHHL